jgi:hypothetical protein
MATFPALKPATRRYSMGVFPVTEERGFGGGSIRFRHGSTAYGHTLELNFTALSQAQTKLIRDHYREQQGGYRSFQLSNEAWAGHASYTDLVPLTTYWRYSTFPTEQHRANGYADVSIALISVPAIISAGAPGLARAVTVSFTGGAASGS